MGNSANILAQGCSAHQPKSSLLSARLVEVAEEIATSVSVRDSFLQYYQHGAWIDEFFDLYSKCDMSKESKMSQSYDAEGTSLISYLAAVGTIWTVKDDHRMDFYSSNDSKDTCISMASSMSNRILILPITLAVAMGSYIRTGKYENDRRITETCPQSCSSDKSLSSTLSTIIQSISHKHVTTSVDMSDDESTVVLIPTSNFDEKNSKILETTEEDKFTKDPRHPYQRLRGIFCDLIKHFRDKEHLDFLLSDRCDVVPCAPTSNYSEQYTLVWLNQFHNFFESFPVAVSVASTTRNKHSAFPLSYLNHAFEAVTQFHREDVLGQSCRFLHSEERTEFVQRDRIRVALQDMQGIRLGLTNVRRDGTPFYNLLALQPVFRPLPITSSRKTVGEESSTKSSSSIQFPQEYVFSHVIGIQYELKHRRPSLTVDLLVVEDLIALLYGILII